MTEATLTRPEAISFEEFYEKYGVRRNPIIMSSAYQNTLVDYDEFGEDIIEDENPYNVWTLLEKGNRAERYFFLSPGITYTNEVIGFFICREKWQKERGYILT